MAEISVNLKTRFEENSSISGQTFFNRPMETVLSRTVSEKVILDERNDEQSKREETNQNKSRRFSGLRGVVSALRLSRGNKRSNVDKGTEDKIGDITSPQSPGTGPTTGKSSRSSTLGRMWDLFASHNKNNEEHDAMKERSTKTLGRLFNYTKSTNRKSSIFDNNDNLNENIDDGTKSNSLGRKLAKSFSFKNPRSNKTTSGSGSSVAVDLNSDEFGPSKPNMNGPITSTD